MAQLSKSYEPQVIESKHYASWQANKLYRSEINHEKKPYSILMPPPNVTGILHFGHVLNHTLQDIYIRRHRMTGNEVCWFPGLDHAGIATQTKVEQELRKEKLTRHDLGREKFTSKVWEWKDKYGGIILRQLRTLGISADWSRTLFTMDESASNAVREVFIRLFDEGLIYRGKRIINWSPLAQSALSDEEVLFREVKEHLFTLRYYIEGTSECLTVSTVRPETIFGDVAVAVNPKDERYSALVGKNVVVPIIGRLVPIITDDYADPTFGTGVVKITPAHDPNDFEVGLRHNLEQPNAINPDATLNDLAGEFAGLDRFVARKKVVERLKELELIEKIEDYTHNVGFSERGGEAVEPYLSDQWFVKMKPLAEPALAAVMNGEISFYPNHWVKTYEHWMTGIRDWCISRQLWWGHRIPVYYSPDGSFTAAHSEAEARQKLGLSSDVTLRQDEDVLDTWFSSWLWPMTTMNWLADGKTEETEEMSYFMPTNLLVTAPEIIFFWVARMIMASLKFKGKIPFKDVYFTSIVRDIKGRKMSKSLGNSPDPVDIIAKYGADAVRFTMIYLSPMGMDIRLDVNEQTQDVPSMEIGRNFANKIWNAGRFILMKQAEAGESKVVLSEKEYSTADKWIMSRFHSTVQSIADALDNHKVTEYSKILYDFIWRDFCDWYVEIMKVQFAAVEDSAYRQGLSNFALSIFDGIMRLLHPVMPFITEELWLAIANRDENASISIANAPECNPSFIQPEIEQQFGLLQEIVEEVRRLRSNSAIPPHEKLPVTLSSETNLLKEFFETQSKIISTLAKCSSVRVGIGLSKPEQSSSSVYRGVEIYLELAGTIDLDKERARLQKELERLTGLEKSFASKLSNEGFLAKAPASVVVAEQEKLEGIRESLMKISANLKAL
ncbi:MAG: valine--tRNA ligase [Ignavibacteriae bacterium]|nr:valine--tRNA ligase [Ignavibacteriota bacterium]